MVVLVIIPLSHSCLPGPIPFSCLFFWYTNHNKEHTQTMGSKVEALLTLLHCHNGRAEGHRISNQHIHREGWCNVVFIV